MAALAIKDLAVRYGDRQAIADINLTIHRQAVTAIIGPSGCGKSTLLRCLNRMNELIPDVHVEGTVIFEDQDILAPNVDPINVRFHIGMVFQKPNPLPKSIFDNVAFGLRINGYRGNVAEQVERSLRRSALWNEVKDRLDQPALSLSGGQQQRLCIARALAVEPKVLLMDEPCAALDPLATAGIEDLIAELRRDHTIVIVTHNMQQAARVADYTAFMLNGRLVEYGETTQLFTSPSDPRTKAYIMGRFG